MRKAGLLEKKPMKATPKMTAAAKNDTGTVKYTKYKYFPARRYTEYESRYYFRAAPSALQGRLEVDLFTRKDLAEGRKEPRFRIFLDYENKDFISWNAVEEKWSSAKIDMLDTGDGRYAYSYRGRNYAAETARKLVNRHLGTGNAPDVETAVLAFQLQVREKELKGRHRLVTDMIDAYMDTVPDRLPADWMRFLNRRALEDGHCILYERGTGTGWCTCCRLHVRVPDTVRHNMTGKCTCGSRITYKSWKKQKCIAYDTRASVIQKCTDGQTFAYRQFHVRMKAEREKEYVPEITVFHEEYRLLFEIPDMKGPLTGRGGYEWGNFRNTGVERWCKEGTVNRGYGYGYSVYAKTTLYTSNLKKTLKGTKLQYVPIADIIKSTNIKLNIIAVLGDMNMLFPYEAFWKMGLKRFVCERAQRDGTTGLTHINVKARKPWQRLGVTKEDMMQAARLDATDRQMRIIQRAAGLGVKLTDEQVLWLDENVGVSVLMKYFPTHTPHRIIRYMKEKAGIPDAGQAGKEALHLWTDYLDTAQQLGWDMGDRSVFFPQDIKRAHDEAVNVFTLQKDKEDALKMKNKDLIMHGYAREIKKAFRYRNSRFMIKVPGCYMDFKREGHKQHNCVATYYEKVLDGRCIILFIRRREAPKKPFCTVEIQNDGGNFRIIQNRTEYNRDAPREAQEFMQAAVMAAQRITDGILKEEKTQVRIKTAV